MDAIINHLKIDCTIFTTNEGHTEHIERMARDYHADGVVHYASQFNSPYVIESYPVEQALIAAGISGHPHRDGLRSRGNRPAPHPRRGLHRDDKEITCSAPE
jgi:hypothetical protein